MKVEERTKVLQNTHDKLMSQINRSQALRDYVVNEEQSIMEVYNWYHKLKNSLMDNYSISIDDVYKFAKVIYEFSNRGYDVIYILKDFLKVESMKFEIKVLGDEIKQLNDNKMAIKSTLKFEESRIEKYQQTMDTYYQLENMNFGLDRLKLLRDTLLEIASIKKQPIKEVSKEFFNYINRYYY